jgi:hypothetical protein
MHILIIIAAKIFFKKILFFLFIFGGLECVGHFFAQVAHFMIFEGCLDSKPERELAVTSRVGTNLATHPSHLATHPSHLATHPSHLATHSSHLATHPSHLATHPSHLATHPSHLATHPSLYFLALKLHSD